MNENLNQKQLFATILAEYIATLQDMLHSEHLPPHRKEQLIMRLAELRKIEFDLPLVPATNTKLTTIADWINLNRGEISVRLATVLRNYISWSGTKQKYIEQLDRRDLQSTQGCGLLTWKEFENIRKVERMKGNQANTD